MRVKGNVSYIRAVGLLKSEAVAWVMDQHLCAHCGSEHIRRNGTQGDQPTYQCKACGYQAQLVPTALAKAMQYAQVEALACRAQFPA